MTVRRSIEHDAENHFVGWDNILKWHKSACAMDAINETDQYEKYFVTLFVTGARVSECLRLRPEQISLTPSGLGIKVDRMEVLKRRKRYTRIFFINRAIDKLADRFYEMCQDCTTDYLLPKLYGGWGIRLPYPHAHTSRKNVYVKIVELAKYNNDVKYEMWPHMLRDQKCYQLSAKKEDGGQEYNVYQLKNWVGWARIDMAAHYVGKMEEEDAARAAGLPESDVT